MTEIYFSNEQSFMKTVRDILTMTRRNVLHNFRLPLLLIVSTLQPVTFLLLFNYVFGGALVLAIPPAVLGSYVNWLIPGLLAQYGIFSGGQTASGIAEDLRKGAFDRFRSLPMARSAVLAGRAISDLIRTALILLILLTLGYMIGFNPKTDAAQLITAFGIALLFAFAWSWVMICLGLFVKTAEAVQGAGFLLLFPIGFASSVFVPVATMPDWLQVFTKYQPVSVVTDALRGLILGPGALQAGQPVDVLVGLALLWSVAIIALFVPLATFLYNRSAN